MKTNRIGKNFWVQRFGEAYELNWKSKGKGHRQADFANAIKDYRTTKEKGTKGTCTGQQVSKWLNGVVPSDENIEAICAVLELPADYFEPSHDDKYKESSRFITSIGKHNARVSQKIGLDLSFVESLRGIVDFDTWFPVYSELCNISDDPLAPKYGRKNNAESAKIDKQLEFMQVNKDGKTITLSLVDLMFLREVQDKVANYVEFLFYQRWETMNKAVNAVNKASAGKVVFNEKMLREYDDPVLRVTIRQELKEV